MASVPKWLDRVMASSTTTGTGTYTLGSAITGYQAWSVVGDGNSAYYCAQEVDGNGNPSGGWEVGLTTYTSSGTTLSRDTILASSNAGAAVSWAAGTRRIMLVSPAAFQTNAGLVQMAGGADAAQTMEVGALYVVDISGYSADRTYTLPAVAAVGDRCGILLSVGDTAFELLITASSGDTLNGVAGGTEWSRLFMAYERVVFRCVVANATWIVEHDGRIPMSAKLRLSTDADGETANTTSLPTDFGGAWTVADDNCNIATTASGRITPRRACKPMIVCNAQSKDAIADAQSYSVMALVGGTERARTTIAPGVQVATAPVCVTLRYTAIVADDYIQMAYASKAGGMGMRALTSINVSFDEVLI